MMKSLILLFLFFSFLTGFTQPAGNAPRVKAEGKNIRITYDQPSKKNTRVFGDMIPYGKVWMVGETSATQITFTKDGNFGGLPVKSGTYNLLAIPSEKEWTIILNAAENKGSSFNYDSMKDKDVLKITVPAKTIDEVTEKLSIRFSETQLILQWDQTQVIIPVSF